MAFDYTYILLGGFRIFEPVTILTNSVFFTLCLIYFRKLNTYNNTYARQMAWFLLTLGTSSVFGATAHAVHYQLGMAFFRVIFFIMNALSLASIYYCFRATYTYHKRGAALSPKHINMALAWVTVLLIYCFIDGNFLLIKIHAGITLIYSMVVHYLAWKRKREKGSRLVAWGIVISFLSIVTHSAKLTLHEWFNYKDISHVIMIISLVVIYQGIKLNVEKLQQNNLQPL